MKPNFALSLSFEGIRLLLRAAGGWRLVGEVPVSSPDLPGDLAALRKQAADLRPGRVRTKLIIPDDQIKYLSISTGDVDQEARMDAARAALEGATPYAVDMLAFDICADGDTTHVAAVARETLTEAEAFASEHRFHPVSFVAAPENQNFLGEPWFGKTAHAANILGAEQDVEPDGVRVVVIGPLEDEGEDPAAVVTDAAPEAPAPAETVVEETAAPPIAAPKDDASAPEKAQGVATDDTTTNPDNTDPSIEDDEDVPLVRFARAARNKTAEAKAAPAPAAQAIEETETKPKPAAPTLDFEPDELTAPPSAFSSRRGGARLGGVTRAAPPPRSAPKLDPEATQPPKVKPQIAADSLRPIAPEAEPEPVATAAAEPEKRSGGFLSRRKSAQAATVVGPAARPAAAAATTAHDPNAEAQRMTIFGARESGVGGKPRFLGLILTAILLVFLAGVAAWASVFLDDRLSWLFQGRERTLASTLSDETEQALAADVGVTISTPKDEDTAEGVAVAALNTSLSDGLTEEDAAVLDALRDPLPAPQPPEVLDAAELEARYAVTGIWPRAPEAIPAPPVVPGEDFYVTGIDPVSPSLDAVALPGPEAFLTDAALPDVSNPAAPGTNFALDDNGRIVPTVDGALSPDGFTVFLGRPPVTPPALPGRADTAPETPEVDAARAALAGLRPRLRPEDLVEQAERASLGGLSRSELAVYRPRLRPPAPQEIAQPDPEPEEETPEVAEEPYAAVPVARLPTEPMLRPASRPRNFDRIVARTQRQQEREQASAPAQRTASVAPRTVAPAIPSTASVAREATVRNAINLRRVNLIGVYGTPSNRRALVRLSNGRYQKVQVGDRFDGGRVSAISDSELRYQKGGRNVVLKMPSS